MDEATEALASIIVLMRLPCSTFTPTESISKTTVNTETKPDRVHCVIEFILSISFCRPHASMARTVPGAEATIEPLEQGLKPHEEAKWDHLWTRWDRSIPLASGSQPSSLIHTPTDLARVLP
jgi:hypothetical protein